MALQTNFSSLLCSEPKVQNAFNLHTPTQKWWRLVLWLHGKPTTPTLGKTERLTCLANGFRFYAALYRMLAFIFLCLSIVFVFWGKQLEVSFYWGAACSVAGMYLWAVSALGYAAAQNYQQHTAQARLALVGFMVMIVAFLSIFVTTISMVAKQQNWLAATPNLMAALMLFAFGVGSYLIEILYLSSDAAE